MKIVFESKTLLRNYREKMNKIRMDTSMCQLVSVRVSLCQVQLGGTSSSWKGFYALMNAITRFYTLSR